MNTKSSRSILRLVCSSGAVAAVLFGGAVSTAFAAASLTPLGFLSNEFPYIEVHGVSGDGSVVVGTSFAYGLGYEAFRWTSGGGMVGLGDLPGGSFESQANGVSADGSVIVGYSDSASGGQAFRWTSGGGMVGLGDLPGAGSYSVARGVSANGSVIVGYSDSTSARQAFRWTSGGGIVGLADLPGGGSYSQATSVSADGSVIVGTGNSASGDEAFRWTSNGGMVGLGKLPGGSPFPYSRANDVSADGSKIVGYGGSGFVYEAFRWTSDGGMVGLGKLPGALQSEAIAVSGDGSIVVGVSTDISNPSVPSYDAFYWTADGGILALWDVLLSHGVDPATDGWTELSAASDISGDGSTIVGYGTRNGETEAFVALIPTVPEPASGALALLGVSSILLFRRRSLGRPNKVSLSKDEPCD